MKKKANIYDADDVERSKRLNFTPEERAARAEHKAEVLGTKLEKAKKKVPKKKKLRLQKELDPEKSKLKHTLRFEEVEKKRGQEALPKKAGRRMVQSASATVHSKIHQVEEENVGTKAAHRTELASEGAAALASHEIRKYRQNAPYKRVEKLEAQVNRANVSAAYRAAVRDNPELQENTVKRLIQKQRIKHQYAKEFRKAKQAEKQGSAFVQKAKDMFGSIGQTVATAVQEHKGGLVMAGAIAMLIIMVFSSLSSCSVMMDGAMSAVLGTSYTSEDPDIIQTEANYTALETALQNELANIERTHPGYDEYRYDVDSIGHIKDYNFGMSQRFQIVAALYENTNLGSTADTAKEAKRDGNDQRTRTGNNQESQGSVNPDAKRLPSNKRRQDCQRKGGKHHRRRVVTGKACNKVLGFSFFIACIFNQVKDFRYGGFPKLFCCLDSQDTSLIDAAADDLHSRFHLTRHGFACEGGCIQSGRTFDDGSIQRDTFTRLYYDNRTDLNFVRVNLHQFAVLFDVRIVRSNIHQTGNRFSGFGNRIRLEPFSNLIEQHNGDTL